MNRIRRVMPPRGLAQIPTRRGGERESVPAHKAYLRISFLELERARHAQEIRTGRARIAALLARSDEIEAEKAQILNTVRALLPPEASDRNGRGSEPGRPRGGRFRYAY